MIAMEVVGSCTTKGRIILLCAFLGKKTQVPTTYIELCGTCYKTAILNVLPKQGDQIGRIFAVWAIFYFLLLCVSRKVSPNLCRRKSMGWAAIWMIFGID
jgi:hypothetical protein